MQLIPDATKTAILQPYIGVGQGMIPSSVTEQLFTWDHALEVTQAQLAHTEAQRFALVQNVAEMQNQFAGMEIEVEVWKAMVQQGQQPPVAPQAAPATPDELHGVSGLSEGSVGGPSPDSPDTSTGSTAGYSWC
jgi:hypothetical protein